jgi:hypothetical protein
MHFKLATSLQELAAYVPRFFGIVDPEAWGKRARQLERDAQTAYGVKIIADYHWLEFSLGPELVLPNGMGHLVPDDFDLRTLAAMYFAGSVVEIYERLSPRARQILGGRIRDCLKSDSGFAPLYLEVEMAQRLLDCGYYVEFADMEGTAQFDLRFSDGANRGEVECKSLSADAGRKIHRKDFYRFVASINDELMEAVAASRRTIIVVTLLNRLPPDIASQTELRQAVRSLLRDGTQSKVSGSFFSAHVEPSVKYFAEGVDQGTFVTPKERLRATFGPSCHVAGPHFSGLATSLVVMKSLREDDTSKPLLEAMRKAAAQLSGTCAGFIAVQFDDLEAEELANASLRRRVGILSTALFAHYGASHVSGNYFCTYGRLTLSNDGIGSPAFMTQNGEPKYPFSAPPFKGSMTDAEFKEAVGGRSGF